MPRLACNPHVLLVASMIVYMCALHANANTPRDDIGARVDAIWFVQRLDFYHSSSSTTYSCRNLRAQIVAILESVGAHPSLVVQVKCSGRTALAHITLASPVEATPENVRVATTFDGRAELVARMRNFPLPTAIDIQHFSAIWRRVSVRRPGQLRFDMSDCELWRGMIRQIFPKLSIRVEGQPRCVEGALPGMPNDVIALVPDSTV